LIPLLMDYGLLDDKLNFEELMEPLPAHLSLLSLCLAKTACSIIACSHLVIANLALDFFFISLIGFKMVKGVFGSAALTIGSTINGKLKRELAIPPEDNSQKEAAFLDADSSSSNGIGVDGGKGMKAPWERIEVGAVRVCLLDRVRAFPSRCHLPYACYFADFFLSENVVSRRSRLSLRDSSLFSSLIMAVRAIRMSISIGRIASVPYTRLNGVSLGNVR
ncbi:hypothetical protein Tco_0872893, partial [Tanacetum coccineum]